MLNWVYLFLNQAIALSQNRQRFWHATRMAALITLVSGVLSGCNQLQFFYQWSEVELDMRVATTDTPGVYSVIGRANLPENTEIAVAAVRYLHPDDRAAAQLNPNPTYSVLAYQPVKVEQGKWQIDLNLWQVARDGRYQEAWQLEQPKLNLSLKPDETVIFLATLTPAAELSELEQQLAKRGIRLPRGSVFSTSEGFRYAQVHHAMAVSLPTGRTTPPPERPEDRNGGWGDRYIIPQEPQNPTNLEFPENRTTNAPASLDEFLQ